MDKFSKEAANEEKNNQIKIPISYKKRNCKVKNFLYKEWVNLYKGNSIVKDYKNI